MSGTPSKCLRIAFVGGDCRRSSQTDVRWFPSRGDAGRRGIRDLLRCIKQHTVDEVILLVRWLGHSDCDALKRACRAHHVRYVLVPGGCSMASAVLQRNRAHD